MVREQGGHPKSDLFEHAGGIEMYKSLEELCRIEKETGKPFWKIV